MIGKARVCRTAWFGLLVVFGVMVETANAGALLDRIRERRSAPQAASDAALPAGGRLIRDVRYGADARQTFDVYLPAAGSATVADAPVIFMVHGGAWKVGDKGMGRVVDAKVKRWVERGFVFISANYRMLPEASVDAQLGDVARALAVAQDKAAEWGGDRRRFILMGHSAGAHLVALLSAAPKVASEPGLTPIVGTVALDSAAMDVAAIMGTKHYGLYDEPFGTDPAYWKSMSPFHTLAAGAPPLLAVCSSRRDDSCAQAQKFAERSRWLGNRAEVLPEDLSHGEINSQLGLDGDYTDAVEKFMAGLDNEAARRLGRRSAL